MFLLAKLGQTCGKYSCACVMPEEKGKILILVLGVVLVLALVRQGRFHGEIRIIVFELVLTSLVKTTLNK